MTRATPAFRSNVIALILGLASAVPSQVAIAAPAPSLTATPAQVRTRAEAVGPVPLWDTAWWITVHATRAQAPLTRLEYSARFTDSPAGRPHTGGWDLDGGDAEGLDGRVVVKCPVRPDYDRRVRVQLRVRDAQGAASDWVVAEFPVRDGHRETAAAAAPGETEPLDAVEAEVTDDMTIGQARAALERKARALGGDGIVGLRVVRSTADHATFAADVVRQKPAAPMFAAAPVPTAVPSERVIGEIVFHDARH